MGNLEFVNRLDATPCCVTGLWGSVENYDSQSNMFCAQMKYFKNIRSSPRVVMSILLPLCKFHFWKREGLLAHKQLAERRCNLVRSKNTDQVLSLARNSEIFISRR